MDYLFLLDRNPDTTLHTQEAAPAHLFSSAEAVNLLTVPDPAATLLSADARVYLFDLSTHDEGGGADLLQASLNLPVENGGDPLVAGVVGTLELYQVVTILAAGLTADQVGSVVLDVQYCAFAAYPGGLTSIVGSSPPTLSSADKSQDTTLTGWTTTIGPGVLAVTVSSAATITQATLSLHLGL